MKDGLTSQAGGFHESSALKAGESVFDHIRQGDPIGPGDFADAGSCIARTLIQGDTSAQNRAQQLAAALYSSAPDGETKAELTGWLVASGTCSQELLKAVVTSDPASILPDVLGETPLEDFLALDAKNKLGKLANRLAEWSGTEPAVPDNPTVPGAESLEAVIPGRQEVAPEDADGNDAPAVAGGPDRIDQLRALLNEPGIDPSVQLGIALELQELGVPALLGLARSGNPGYQEVAYAGYTRWGRDQGRGQDAIRDAIALEGNPSTRRLGESIRAAVQGDEFGPSRGAEGKGRWSDGPVSTNWLDAAFQSADSPSILAAAAGREVYAIPVAMRRLWKLRNI